jgi:hypothetical protein
VRWLFLLLLGINAAIFLWGQQRPDNAHVAVQSSTDEGVPTIHLLTVEELAQLRDVSTGALEQEAQGEIAPLDTSKDVPGPAEEKVEERSLIAATPNSESVPTVDQNVSPGRAGGDSIVEETQEPSVSGNESVEDDRIAAEETVTETDSDADETRMEESVVAGEALVAERVLHVPLKSCWTIGPLSDLDLAHERQQSLAQKGLDTELREEQSRDITGYWVLLPPFDEVRQAIDAVNSLKAQGVVDVQRFYKGEFERGVSLGVYNRRFNAEKRKAQIETKGFIPDVLPRYRLVPSYWLDYQLSHDSQLQGELEALFQPLVPAERECN